MIELYKLSEGGEAIYIKQKHDDLKLLSMHPVYGGVSRYIGEDYIAEKYRLVTGFEWYWELFWILITGNISNLSIKD